MGHLTLSVSCGENNTTESRWSIMGMLGGFHCVVIPRLHEKRTAGTERDVFGAVLVVILTGAVVFLVRLALAN